MSKRKQTSKLHALMKRLGHPKYCLYVDPGLVGTGWAFSAEHDLAPDLHGVLHGGKASRVRGSVWFEHALSISHEFGQLVKQVKPEVVILEQGMYWAGSSKSEASTRSGDMFKLLFLTGCLAQTATPLLGYCNKLLLVTPDEWKGNLSKEIVGKRVAAYWGPDCVVQNHALDCVGMALSALGEL